MRALSAVWLRRSASQEEDEDEEAKRDVPSGSEVEVFIKIDQSFAPRADAFVPVLDEEFEIQVELGRTEAPNLTTLSQAMDEVADRYAQLRERAGVRAPEAVELLDWFHSDGVLDELRRLVALADPDAARTCQVRLRDAQTALDEVEEALKLPELIDEAEGLLESVRPLVDQWGDSADRQDLQAAQTAIDAAVKARDRTVSPTSDRGGPRYRNSPAAPVGTARRRHVRCARAAPCRQPEPTGATTPRRRPRRRGCGRRRATGGRQRSARAIHARQRAVLQCHRRDEHCARGSPTVTTIQN
ncbi:MAG: hypothetical protein ACRDQZ_12980, partial [Mycobacteriales bacterium]